MVARFGWMFGEGRIQIVEVGLKCAFMEKKNSRSGGAYYLLCEKQTQH